MFFNNPYRINNYDRKSAVKYALNYAMNPNPAYRYFQAFGDGGGDCSNFISQCLKNGGAPFAFDSNPWWYNNKETENVMDDTWSLSWAVAHSLFWTLKIRAQKNMKGLSAQEVQNMDMIDLGDLIQYENYKGIIYHTAIVTNFTNEGGRRLPLISQHTYNAINISYFKPAAKKTHFMKIQIS